MRDLHYLYNPEHRKEQGSVQFTDTAICHWLGHTNGNLVLFIKGVSAISSTTFNMTKIE